MWHDIAVTNRDETVLALREVREGLDKTIEAMNSLAVVDGAKPLAEGENDHSEALARIFKAGNDGRASLFVPGRNAAASFSEITVQLKDKPGALLSVMQPLAQEGLNIRDIELMKVRENVAGTLLLAFKTPEEAARAVNVLRYLEYDPHKRFESGKHVANHVLAKDHAPTHHLECLNFFVRNKICCIQFHCALLFAPNIKQFYSFTSFGTNTYSTIQQRPDWVEACRYSF